MRLGLLGHPVAHSLSPLIQRAALTASGLDGQYSLFDLPDVSGLDGHFAALREGRCDGLNVTLPYKREAALRCDEVRDDARVLGVVNTLVPEQGRVVGHNTDVAGLVHAIQRRWPALDAQVVTVLGAGGAARAAVLAAVRLGAREVRVWNRTTGRAHELAEALAALVKVKVIDDPVAACAGSAVIVQSGSGDMGFTVASAAWQSAVVRAERVLSEAAADAKVIDLVYQPRLTPWVEAALRGGREADDGLAMLVLQAWVAFERWTGVRVPVDALFAAVG